MKAEEMTQGTEVRCSGYVFFDNGDIGFLERARADVDYSCGGGAVHLSLKEKSHPKHLHGFRAHPVQLEKYDPPKPEEFELSFDEFGKLVGIREVATSNPRDFGYFRDYRDQGGKVVRVREVLPEERA